MTSFRPTILALAIQILSMPAVMAYGDSHATPQAGARTNAQNFKDMVLATCVANAYRENADAATDVGSSVSALRDWTSYDLEQSPDAIEQLVDAYLKRDYHNPLVESEIKGIRFDFLKCLDLYHSQDLAALVNRLVIDPTHTYRSDTITTSRPK